METKRILLQRKLQVKYLSKMTILPEEMLDFHSLPFYWGINSSGTCHSWTEYLMYCGSPAVDPEKGGVELKISGSLSVPGSNPSGFTLYEKYSEKRYRHI